MYPQLLDGCPGFLDGGRVRREGRTAAGRVGGKFGGGTEWGSASTSTFTSFSRVSRHRTYRTRLSRDPAACNRRRLGQGASEHTLQRRPQGTNKCIESDVLSPSILSSRTQHGQHQFPVLPSRHRRGAFQLHVNGAHRTLANFRLTCSAFKEIVDLRLPRQKILAQQAPDQAPACRTLEAW